MVIALALAGCDAPVPPDILLVTLDTTRADALGPWGASPSPSPTLDRLAAEGLVWDEAMSVTPLTLPAHASILTGLLPARHGLRGNGGRSLGDDVETVATRLRTRGYRTGAFVSAAVLDGMFGLDRGFDTYVDGFDVVGANGLTVPSRPANETSDAACAWLLERGRDPEPAFAWLHLYDAHAPYVPHANGFADPYLSEIAYADARVGEVLDAWRTARPDRPLAVVVTADHGEGRGDHGEATHGWFVYRSTMHVPLVVHAPGISPGRRGEPVSLVDVAPTLLALSGAEIPPGLDGRDLLASPEPDRIVYGETFTPRDALGFSELRVAQDARHRFILAPRRELYDWRADPGETAPLRDPARPQLVAVASSADDRVEAPRQEGPTAALEALGYVIGEPLVPTDAPFATLPDPKDAPDALDGVYAIIRRARSVSPERGVPLLEAALREFPRAGMLRVTLSRAYELVGRIDDARAVLMPPGVSGSTAFLARRAELALRAGDLDEAGRLARDGVETNPADVGAYVVLAEALRRRGRPDEAADIADRGLALSESTPQLWLLRGACDLDRGDAVAALPRLGHARELDPASTDTAQLLARALALTGEADQARALLASLPATASVLSDLHALGQP